MFEWEYLYQKKWNGKLYDTNENIISELINGNGKVKEYDEEYGYISFEGEYLNEKRYGKGKEYRVRKISFDGEYFNGKRHGKGIEYGYTNFKAQIEEYLPEEEQEKRYEYVGTYLIYDGEYINGKRHGKGKLYKYGKLIFEGEFFNGEIVRDKNKKIINNIYNYY